MKNLSVILAALISLVGCATPEVLEPRDGTVPFGVNLSGSWEIRGSPRAGQAQVRDAIRRTDGVKDDELFRKSERQDAIAGRRPRRSGVRGGLVYVFLELGKLLKVTQTADGLFISFDRSVVEEYRFGENRRINVGAVEAQRVTGWDGSTLVVETLDRNKMKMTERFRLTENDQVLERTIILRSKAMEEARVVQLFDRKSN